MTTTTSNPAEVGRAVVLAAIGIGLYSVMDALMKSLAVQLGAYNAALWRGLIGCAITGLIYLARRKSTPKVGALRLHLVRGMVSSVLIFLFFWGVARAPLAEGIALSFIAPLITLYLAALILKEKITARAVVSSCLGLVGVGVIMAGRLNAPHGREATMGMIAILISAVAYAYNLILQRQQALVAQPEESAFFGTLVMSLCFSLAAPWRAHLPPLTAWPMLVGAAAFASAAFLVLSTAYAKAETKVLVSLEYSAFLWAALFGWLMFKEPVTVATLGGAVLIVAACLYAATGQHHPLPEAEIGL